jgi:hypothetical protein
MKPIMIPIPAAGLLDGHLVRIGSSTNYVLVAAANEIEGKIAVTIYNGDTPQDRPNLHLEPDEVVHLSACPDTDDHRWPTGGTR